MGKKLKIGLPDDWVNDLDQDGPLTVCWDNPNATGALQVSTAEYTGGPEPRPSEADLIELAIGFGRDNQLGQLLHSSSGKCVMGTYGTAVFNRAPSLDYSQVWFLSNGLDFVFVTFLAENPQDRELADAQRIAEGVDFK